MRKPEEKPMNEIKNNNDSNKIKIQDNRRMLRIVLPLILALISMLVLTRISTSRDFHAKTIASLDDKKSTVMELTAASTAASAALTLLPGDTATPIAEKLADLSTYFLIVLCAIYVEKYLVTMTGYAAFFILIPLGCIMYAAGIGFGRHTWERIARKLALFGIAIALVIPVSVKVSDLIEHTYQSSIQETVDAAKKATQEIQSSSEGQQDSDSSDNRGVLSGIISGIKNGVSDISDKVESVLNNFIEALAVMLVTSCVIPVLVLVFFGFVPVCGTYYVQAYTLNMDVVVLSLVSGLAIDTLLMVNNYRDREQDAVSGKCTLVVRYGKKFGENMYLALGIAAVLLCFWFVYTGKLTPLEFIWAPCVYLYMHALTWRKMIQIGSGKKLNSILGETSRNMLFLGLLLAVALN